jgi:hypothetical protein
MRSVVMAVIGTLGMLSFGCGDGKNLSNDGGLIHRDGPTLKGEISTHAPFTIFDLTECGQAGYQTVGAAAGNKVVFATLAETNRKATCAIENRTAETAVYDLCVVLPTAAGFSGSIVTSQPYTAKMGVGVALDGSGEPVLAYTGGPSAALRCGASDLLIANVSGGQLGTPRTIATGSVSTGMPPDQAANCAAQNVCNQGDATGYWPSMALDPASKSLGVAFRDLHFGFADTDFAKSDVEFARGDTYSVFTVDVARGGGTYNRLAFSPTGKAAIIHYTLDYLPAIWLDRETDQGFVAKKLFTGKIREGLAFGISPEGLYALAYFDETRKLLVYRESTDGDNFTIPEDVDRDGITGYYPSLAFDDQGSPVLAYYRCGDYGVGEGCDGDKDGLYLARRQVGSWDIRKIRGESGIRDGLYPAIAFVGGKTTIAFQSAYYDPITATSRVSLHIAKEP